MAAVHALAYPLGARFHIPHGLSNSLVLAPVMRFNLQAAAPLYAELAAILLPEIQGSVTERAHALIDHLEALPVRLGLPTRLRDVGITLDDLDALAIDATKQTRLLNNNPREVTLDDIQSIYRQVF
ncbi:Lactaldehyde reductase [compost metagenome]